jgi:hypothetical protein
VIRPLGSFFEYRLAQCEMSLDLVEVCEYDNLKLQLAEKKAQLQA